ncbi:MAG: nucleotidyl transferase AbiEii/AbiGii toxin family protein [Elusimicrobiota bacterium]|jgi:hypothetical protein
MIPINHIHQQAARDGVKERAVEKDYALTWFLLALGELSEPLKGLRFKGGTCIRKMYFPHWRYSEDIDFTLTDPALLQSCAAWISQIAKKAGQLSGMAYTPQTPESQPETGQLENQVIYVDYVGPLQRTGSPRKFKVDITASERLIDPPTQRKVSGLFADQKDHHGKLNIYSLEEICSEKMRSLIQRREPRDLYDIWRLMSEVPELDRSKVTDMFMEKCRFKKIPLPTLRNLLGSHNIPTLEKLWSVRLGEQLADLPHFEEVIRETRRRLRACES